MFKASLCTFTEILLGILLEESVFSWRVCSVSCCVWSGWSSDWRLYHTLYTHVAFLLNKSQNKPCQRRSNRETNEMRYTLLLTHQLFCKVLIIDTPTISSIQKYQISVSLTSVYEGVFLHVGFLVESLATVLAGIWPCVWVDQEVGGQSGWAFEYLATFLALKCSFLKLKMNKCNDRLQITIVYQNQHTEMFYKKSIR